MKSLIALSLICGFAYADVVPRHVELGYLLMNPDYTNASSYSTQGKSGVIFPSPDKEPRWMYRGSVNTNAVGFINALVENSKSLYNVRANFSSFDNRDLTYYWNAINSGKKGFFKIDIANLKIGDFIVFKCGEKVKCGNPIIKDTGGHIAIVLSSEEIRGQKPFIMNTKQYLVQVMDVAYYNHGEGDTRKTTENNGLSIGYKTGLGIGFIRVYANNGVYYGHANGTSEEFISTNLVQIATGRAL